MQENVYIASMISSTPDSKSTVIAIFWCPFDGGISPYFQ